MLEKIDTPEGRYYNIRDGVSYPSITTILEKTSNKTGLNEWRSNVGENEADRIVKRAANRGSIIHKYCEDYLTGKLTDYSILDAELIFQANSILPDISNVIHIEEPLFSDTLQLAGTVDLIAQYKYNSYIIDWKTARKVKQRHDIENYFIQASFYAFAYYEMTGTFINNIKICIFTDDELLPVIYDDKATNWKEQLKIRRDMFYAIKSK